MMAAALAFVVLSPCTAARAGDGTEAFEDGNRLYRRAAEAEGERRTSLYRAAAARYADATAAAPNAYALYNLGNALYRAGELGRAIGAYRRAEFLMPRFAPLRRNLALARDNAPGGDTAPAPHPAAAAFFFWHYAISLAEAEGLTALFFVLCMAALSVRLFVGERSRRRLRTAAIALGVLAGVFAISSMAKLASPDRTDAVVVAREASVRSEPAGRSVELYVLRAGAEVRVLKRAEAWTRIESDRGGRGWVETGSLDLLSESPLVPPARASGT
jgi:hypothetical protein